MKPKSKKILQICAPIVGVGVFTTIIVCVSGVLVTTPTVSIGGSTAILPLMNTISEHYKDIDIVTSAGGSGMGINSIINGTKEIGMASKNPGIKLSDINDKRTKTWIDKKIKTLTIAWDGIGIVYKPSNSTKDKDINIDSEVLAKIYTAFSGVKKITLGDLTGDQNDKTEIVPFARNGGSNISGTADGFLNDSHLDYKNSNYYTSLNKTQQEEIVSNLENGSYGNNIVQTSEPNSQAWNRAKHGPSGSMVYLSSGYILNNLDEIKNAGFKIAKYDGKELKKEYIASGYNWYRPFNLIYSTSYIKNNTRIIEFLKWLIDPNKKQAKEIIEKEGYVCLNESALWSMAKPENKGDFDKLILTPDSDLNRCGAGESK